MTDSTPSSARVSTPHAVPADDVLHTLHSDPARGLDAREVAARRREYGPNALPAPPRRSPLQRFLQQFNNLLIYVLLGAGLVTLLLGHFVDASVIFGVTVINAVIGFIQEGKAESALDAIRDMLAPHAQVLRDGQRQDIAAEDLVPGDIVYLASGDRVPADLRMLAARTLRIEEGVLTGESVGVEKAVEPVAVAAELGDRSSMAYSGTLVSSGQGHGVVVATGTHTEIGRISTMLGQVEELSTPLLRKIAGFSQTLTWVVLLIAAIAFAFGTWVRNYPASDMFLAAVGIAVAAIPEGLPAIMTITLAIGVQRMARRHAIIRRLPAVEALGSVTVVCTDKTGTLTRNEMTVQRLITSTGLCEVSGVGYAPEGACECAGQPVDAATMPLLGELARAVVLCSDAALNHEGETWSVVGDPTEGALLTLAAKLGVDASAERARWPRIDCIPFESEHRFMATLHHDDGERAWIVLKGAPERVLGLCANTAGSDGSDDTQPLDDEALLAHMRNGADDGMRMLAIAVRSETGAGVPRELGFTDIERGGFTLLAVCALTDPPRDEAIAAVARCHAAGVRVKMITGDHAATATAIARQLGLNAERAMTGAEIEALDDAALGEVVQQIDIYARASPEHKLRLVHALQARGEVVAMTGDGVNDAPALKRADVGVAMGCKGTEAAKEAAEMVLADDNFASVAAAVEEGRTVYDNLRKGIAYVMPTSIGQAAMVFCAVLLGMTMPITPAQILWVNMITAVTLALALAFEKPEADIMQRPPRPPDAPLLDGFLAWRIVFVSALLVAGGIGLFVWEHLRGASLEAARTVAVNALMVGEAFYLFNVRAFHGSVLNREGVFGNRYVLGVIAVMLVCQLALTYLPFFQHFFQTAPIGLDAWLRILLFGVILLLVVEAEKALMRR